MKGNNFSYISWYNVGAHVAIFIPQKCRRSERYFRYKNTCPMLIKLGNIGKVFCMNGFLGRPEKRDIKREETKVEIWPSHILFTAYNRTFITVCIELVVGSYSLGDGRPGRCCVICLFIFYSCQWNTFPAIWGKVFETCLTLNCDGRAPSPRVTPLCFHRRYFCLSRINYNFVVQC